MHRFGLLTATTVDRLVPSRAYDGNGSETQVPASASLAAGVGDVEVAHGEPRVIIAPITSAGQALGCRPEVIFQRKKARILLDQLRCVDQTRLGKKIGKIDEDVWHAVLLELPG